MTIDPIPPRYYALSTAVTIPILMVYAVPGIVVVPPPIADPGLWWQQGLSCRPVLVPGVGWVTGAVANGLIRN